VGYGFDEELARKAKEEYEARRKAEKSLAGSAVSFLIFGGIALVVLVLLYGFADLSGTPDVDRLPPSSNP
jgi:hypothetical protein